MLWLILGLLCAVFFAISHIVSKKIVDKADPQYIAFAKLLFTAILTTPLLFFFWDKLIITSESLLLMVIIGVMIVIGGILYMSGLKYGSVSKTIPLLSLSPLFTLVIAMFWVQEYPNRYGIFGVIILVIGTYVLNIEKSINTSEVRYSKLLAPFAKIFTNKGARLMFFLAIFWGLSSVVDKAAINASNAISRILLYSYFAIVFFFIYLLLKEKSSFLPKLKETLKNNIKGLLVLVILNFLVIATQMFGISLTHTAYIIALKRASAIFTVIFAFFILKEKENFLTILIGTLLLVLGVILIVI